MHKIIHDSVHGSLKIGGVHLELLQRPELQRLQGVHQLGLAYLVFPGANHTRMEHSLGVHHLSSLMCGALGVEGDEREDVLAAALLHDIGHPPFSHTLEEVMVDRFGMDHMEVTKAMIDGDVPFCDPADGDFLGPMVPIAELLEASDVSAEKVGELIVSPRSKSIVQGMLPIEGNQAFFGRRDCLNQIIHGPVDADQMDYLLRDAHYTGVAHGTIDIDRLLRTIAIFHGDLVVSKGGVTAVEGLIVARALMYTSVYFHKTVRIAEMMLCKAVEEAEEDVIRNAQLMTDGALLEALLAQEGEARRLAQMLRYRRLYKKALFLPTLEVSDGQLECLLPLTNYRRRKEAEREIADRAGVRTSEVILDLPQKTLLLLEQRIGKTEVPILNGDRVRPLSKYSPLTKAMQFRPIHDWALMVSCPEAKSECVERAAKKVLFS